MKCPNCGTHLAEDERICTLCGTQILSNPIQKPLTKEDLPDQFRVLSPWAYFGLQILYSIPVVGFIFLLIHTFSSGNLNRRSFARSYWCVLVLVCILAAIVAIIGVGAGLYFAPTKAQEMGSLLIT